MNESSFCKKLMRMLEDRGAVVFKIHGHGMQESGWPDLYVAGLVFTGWIELKVGRRKVTPLQKERMRMLVERGVPAFVLRLEDGVVCIEDSCREWDEDGEKLLEWFSSISKIILA